MSDHTRDLQCALQRIDRAHGWLGRTAAKEQATLFTHVTDRARNSFVALVERVMALSHLFGAEEFVGEFKYGKMTREQGEKNMRLFAKEVLPALHEATPADPLPANRPAAAAASV